MQIVHMNDGPKIDYQLENNILRIADIEINLQERQRDTETVINISKNDVIHEGIGYWLLATVVLPPKKYTIIEEEEIDGEEIKTRIEALPLDTEMVKLYLFSIE
ncbi:MULTISPECIES: hypothetical protein [Caloramator]|uniref:Uncharacterized protein n=1 Tax=Caloramator australicus RC3 TaxID=857293 RepID=I7KT87_9CLOT|nr:MULTISPECIES: hypothetical protein [Caloramator]MDO6355267.1 hypothetical protein [Caloramator sp. CAR-1]CCJ32903.1 hypothetical protein CAAU_0819 [Caloramator australicus RC3]